MRGDGTFHQWISGLDAGQKRELVRALGRDEARSADDDWESWAHDGQRALDGDWRTWVIMAGRGFGKTLAGAQWVRRLVRGDLDRPHPNPSPEGEGLRIALVGATLDEARRVMVEGRSGLLNVAAPLVADWHPSRRLLRFTTGAEATLFSGASPEALRGPEHHFAWCDELAKWDEARNCWDMLQLGLRLGDRPRALVTTTPRPGAVLKAIMGEADCITTGGPTRANPHLSRAFKDAVEGLYAGTRLGRQELEGELLSDTPGALWTVELLETCRMVLLPLPLAGEGRGEGVYVAGTAVTHPHPPAAVRLPPSPASGRGAYVRIVIGVDPPAGPGTCGIVACALDAAGRGHVLADHSVTGRSPEGWARAVAAAVEVHHASAPTGPGQALVVAEANQGGKMVESVLRAASASLRVKLVHASQGKSARADPVATLFEAGRVRLHGRFPELEAELCGLIGGGGYAGPGVSPDRADAMVWALTELMLGKERGVPRVRGL